MGGCCLGVWAFITGISALFYSEKHFLPHQIGFETKLVFLPGLVSQKLHREVNKGSLQSEKKINDGHWKIPTRCTDQGWGGIRGQLVSNSPDSVRTQTYSKGCVSKPKINLFSTHLFFLFVLNEVHSLLSSSNIADKSSSFLSCAATENGKVKLRSHQLIQKIEK